MTMSIDSHHHLWEPARGNYDWLVPGSPLDRPFAPRDFRPVSASVGVTYAVLVQAAATTVETDYLMSLARENAYIAGVVGWIDLAGVGSVAQIEARSKEPLFVGVRPMLQDMVDRDWILSRDCERGLCAIEEHGLNFDALVRADQLGVVDMLAHRYPELRIVLDHAGKPPFADPTALNDWRHSIERLAARPNVACKLSGLLTELPTDAPQGIVANCIDVLINLFADGRLLWGSDWPVATLVTEYRTWYDICRDRVSEHNAGLVPAIFRENACQFYRLTIRRPATEE